MDYASIILDNRYIAKTIKNYSRIMGPSFVDYT